MSNSPKRFCPYCCAKVVLTERRMNGNSFCENDHAFPTGRALPSPSFTKAVDNAMAMINRAMQSKGPRSYAKLQEIAQWAEELQREAENTLLTKGG